MPKNKKKKNVKKQSANIKFNKKNKPFSISQKNLPQKILIKKNSNNRFFQYWIFLKTLLRKNLSYVWSWGILFTWIVFTIFSFGALYYWNNDLKMLELIPYQITIPDKVIIKYQCEVFHPVTGMCLHEKEKELLYSVEDLEKAKVFTVMVENHTAARPQSGLSEADVVYEALVEGGFTRFMVVFDSLQNIKEIGPVRSARDYYLWWTQEYNQALYAHVGGSPKSLNLITQQKIVDCDEFYHGNIFERVTWRYAPHNTYISIDNLGRCRPDQVEAGLFSGIDTWKYSNEKIITDIEVNNLLISYSQNKNYEVEWQYNAQEDVYYRFNAGQPHLDKNNNQQITAKNVIVMEALSRVIDDVGRLEMNNIGHGPVIIYTQGSKQKGEWQKAYSSDRTRFVDKEGNNLLLSPGNTWIQVVPSYFNAISEK